MAGSSPSPIVGPVPVAATAPPPPIAGLSPTAGTTAEYARADHTHATSVQKAKIITDANGVAKWTFGKPFAGTNFAAIALPQSTAVVTISITELAPDGTYVTFTCKQSKSLPAALLSLTQLLNFNIFSDPAAGLTLHCFAGAVTQTS